MDLQMVCTIVGVLRIVQWFFQVEAWAEHWGDKRFKRKKEKQHELYK